MLTVYKIKLVQGCVSPPAHLSAFSSSLTQSASENILFMTDCNMRMHLLLQHFKNCTSVLKAF
jgi:hypothetical protein